MRGREGGQPGVQRELKSLRVYVHYNVLRRMEEKEKKGEGEKERSTLVLLKGHPLSVPTKSYVRVRLHVCVQGSE